jgi:hypothetical protein
MKISVDIDQENVKKFAKQFDNNVNVFCVKVLFATLGIIVICVCLKLALSI